MATIKPVNNRSHALAPLVICQACSCFSVMHLKHCQQLHCAAAADASMDYFHSGSDGSHGINSKA
jgi:hypothetical protein